MRHFFYLFFVIIGLSFSSCEQQNLITEPVSDDLVDQIMTIMYQGQEYTVELNKEATVEVADLDPVLAEIWHTGHFVVTEDIIYLYDTMEEVDALTKELYPDADLSGNNEDIESRNNYYVGLYDYSNTSGQSYFFNSPRSNIGYMNNKASSMRVVNNSNRTIRVTLYQWQNWGGATVHYNIPPYYTFGGSLGAYFNNRTSSVWVRQF